MNGPADLGAIASSLPGLQEPLRVDLAARIGRAWAATDWSVATTGLLSALQPDLWTFPDLSDDEDLRRQAFRQLGEAIAGPALANEAALQAFLIAEAVVRNGRQPPSVRDRLTAAAADDVDDLERNWNYRGRAAVDRAPPGRRRAVPPRRSPPPELLRARVRHAQRVAALARRLRPGGRRWARTAATTCSASDHDPAERDASGRTRAGIVTGTTTTYIEELRSDLEHDRLRPARRRRRPSARSTTRIRPPTSRRGRSATGAGSFGAHLEAAVREFQIYASLPFVARLRRDGRAARRLRPPEPRQHPDPRRPTTSATPGRSRAS